MNFLMKGRDFFEILEPREVKGIVKRFEVLAFSDVFY